MSSFLFHLSDVLLMSLSPSSLILCWYTSSSHHLHSSVLLPTESDQHPVAAAAFLIIEQLTHCSPFIPTPGPPNPDFSSDALRAIVVFVLSTWRHVRRRSLPKPVLVAIVCLLFLVLPKLFHPKPMSSSSFDLHSFAFRLFCIFSATEFSARLWSAKFLLFSFRLFCASITIAQQMLHTDSDLNFIQNLWIPVEMISCLYVCVCILVTYMFIYMCVCARPNIIYYPLSVGFLIELGGPWILFRGLLNDSAVQRTTLSRRFSVRCCAHYQMMSGGHEEGLGLVESSSSSTLLYLWWSAVAICWSDTRRYCLWGGGGGI